MIHPKAKTQTRNPMKILIVDDTKLSRAMILKRIPESVKNNAMIFQAVNGLEGLELYKELKPDIVFLDLTMPVMDGFEALEKIRAFDRDARVFIITADIQAKAREKVLGLGAAGIEKKPIDENRLAEIFATLS